MQNRFGEEGCSRFGPPACKVDIMTFAWNDRDFSMLVHLVGIDFCRGPALFTYCGIAARVRIVVGHNEFNAGTRRKLLVYLDRRCAAEGCDEGNGKGKFVHLHPGSARNHSEEKPLRIHTMYKRMLALD